MSTTYTVGREVFAMRTDRGTALYLLTEKTYESNVSPQTPHWQTIYFGEASGAVQRIFSHAASCEGGMLATPSRRSTPESYIASWLQHLTKPRALPITEATMRITDSNGWIGTGEINRDQSDVIATILKKQGFPEKANALLDIGICTLSFAAHGEALVAICAETPMSPWRLLSAPEASYDAADPLLAIDKTPRTRATESFRPARRIPDESMILMQDEDENWRAEDWAYGLVGDYVKSLGSNGHVPANFKSLIEAYRDHIEKSPIADATTLKVRIDTNVAVESKYYAQRIEEAKTFKDAVNDNGIVTVPFTQARAYALTAMPREATTWIIPDDPEALSAIPMALFAF